MLSTDNTPACITPAQTFASYQFTPGTYAAHSAAAAAARAEAQEYARKNFKQHFVDKPHWMALAGARGFRLPTWYRPATGPRIKHYSERLGLSMAELNEATGCRSFRSLAELNPTWPLYAVVGLLLELAVELKK